MKNVLFLCTQNSARSIIAEAISNFKYNSYLNAYSAGGSPSGIINPLTLQTLEKMRIPTDKLYSKSWDKFNENQTLSMDYVVTVCGNAAKETCPVWIGSPKKIHFNIEDPVNKNLSSHKHEQLFIETFHNIDQLIKDNLINE